MPECVALRQMQMKINYGGDGAPRVGPAHRTALRTKGEDLEGGFGKTSVVSFKLFGLQKSA